MPLLRIETNLAVNPEVTERLLKKATELVVRELNKPIEYVQVMLKQAEALCFGGTTQPNAFVELRSLGLPADRIKPLSRAVADLLSQELGVPPNRLFINFCDVDRTMWGWNGDTFG